MKKTLLTLMVASIFVASATAAQTEATGQKTLAATVGVYVFPEQGQDAATQSKNEAECYNWAVDTTKTDPFDLQKQAQQQQAQADAAQQQVAESGQGAGAKGAVGGAAAGALVGEIFNNDAGQGAKYGAAAGLVAGRSKARRAKKDASEDIEAQNQYNQAVTGEQVEGFKKAFAACLEAKDYVVKF